MAKLHVSTKRLQINKANSSMVIVMAVSAVVVVFSLVAARALWSQRAYQARVISEKQKANTQLKENLTTANALVTSYKAFVETPENMIGGNPKGTGERDGDNAKITLDALPSKYDFPALASSLEKILSGKNYKVDAISGKDDEIAQANKSSEKPEPIEIPFEVSVSGSFDSMKELMNLFERSIRPIKVGKLTISGGNNDLKVQITAVTYYQPATNLNIQTKEVK